MIVTTYTVSQCTAGHAARLELAAAGPALGAPVPAATAVTARESGDGAWRAATAPRYF
ncbi:MAG TPA: hypothetical protein VGG24_01920 [Paraburkholderia sp.]|jgi:hypothetical protein